MHYPGHYETPAIFPVQSSEQRKVCLNKAQISNLSRAYQLVTNHNLEAAFYLRTVYGNPSWAFVPFREAGCAVPRTDDEEKAGSPQLRKRSAGVPCCAAHLDPKDDFSHRSSPFAGRGHAREWITERCDSAPNELEMKLTLAFGRLLKDKLYLNWLKNCQYKVKPSHNLSANLNQWI